MRTHRYDLGDRITDVIIKIYLILTFVIKIFER